MNLDDIKERIDSINRMRAISNENQEVLFRRSGLSRVHTYQDMRSTEIKSSKLLLRFGISLVLLGMVYFMDYNDFNLFSLTSEKIKEVISYNIEFEDVMTFWYNDNISKIVDTLIRT